MTHHFEVDVAKMQNCWQYDKHPTSTLQDTTLYMNLETSMWIYD